MDIGPPSNGGSDVKVHAVNKIATLYSPDGSEVGFLEENFVSEWVGLTRRSRQATAWRLTP
jgi:hypothetical protein